MCLIFFFRLVAMDSTNRLLKGAEVVPNLGAEEKLLEKPKPSGVKCDIVNECQMFINAEDGGGDTRLHLNEHLDEGKSYSLYSINISAAFHILICLICTTIMDVFVQLRKTLPTLL